MSDTITVKLNTGMFTNGRAYDPGSILEWDKADATKKDGLIERGYAEEVKPAKTQNPQRN